MHYFDLIFKTLDADADLSANEKAWLKSSILKWMRGVPFAKAFDISVERKVMQRNKLIIHYARALDASSDWAKARLILIEVKRLDAGLKSSPMLSRANEFRRIPKSQRQIFRIICEIDKTS